MIRISTDIPKKLISSIVSKNIDVILQNEELDYKGFAVDIKRSDDIQITARKKSIYLDLPLDINILKPNGLFSIEAKGTILLNVTITTDISSELVLSTSTAIDGWKWLVEPKVKVGVLNIPVSPLANLVMNRMDDRLTAQIDSTVAEKIDFQNLINKRLASLIDSQRISQSPELYLRAQLEAIYSPGFREYSYKIELPLYLSIDNKVTAEYEVSNDWDIPPFRWIENDLLEHSQDVNIALKYDKLAEIVREKVNGMVIGGKALRSDLVEISHQDQLHIKVNITKPIESEVSIIGIPVIENGKAHLQYLRVDMQTPNIIYKMTAPIVEKLIRSDIDDRLPIDLQEILSEQVRMALATANQLPYLDLRIDANQTKLVDVTFSETHLNAKIVVKEVEIALAVEHMDKVMVLS